MHFKFLFPILLICLNCKLIRAQVFKQLLIKEDSITNFLSSTHGKMYQLNAFGRFRYNLLLTEDKEVERSKYGKYSSNYFTSKASNASSCLFTTIDTETGKVDFLKVDSNYYPITFLNNDTLILRLKKEVQFVGFSTLKKTFCTIPNHISELLIKVPSYFKYYKYKISNNHEEMVLLSDKENDSNYFKLFYFEHNILHERKIANDQYFKTWDCLDLYWIDNDNILLFLVKAAINGPLYCQKIYNVKKNSVIDIILPKSDYSMDDYYDGHCIIRKLKDPQALIYSLNIENDKVKLIKTHQINTPISKNDPLYELGFVSKNKIAIITNIEAEKSIFSLWLNLNSYKCKKLEIQTINALHQTINR